MHATTELLASTVKLWRRPEATCVTTFTGNSEMPQLAMTADATLIAAGERGGLTRVS